MSDERLPTEFIVGAQIRRAAKDGVPITIVRRGDRAGGSIILKINLLNGMAHVLMQVRMDEDLVWSPATTTDPLSEADADKFMARQAGFDPDLWLIEIEDRKGRHWFPGKRLSS